MSIPTGKERYEVCLFGSDNLITSEQFSEFCTGRFFSSFLRDDRPHGAFSETVSGAVLFDREVLQVS